MTYLRRLAHVFGWSASSPLFAAGMGAQSSVVDVPVLSFELFVFHPLSVVVSSCACLLDAIDAQDPALAS